MIEFSKRIALACGLLCVFAGASRADTITLPSSRLVSSTSLYYTDLIGGGIGDPVEMLFGDGLSDDDVHRSDDGVSAPIPLLFPLKFFNSVFDTLWVNNNGNVTLSGGFPNFRFDALANTAIIAPFFADVDTNNPSSGLVYLRTDIAEEIIVTWDQVGYYRQNVDKLNSFQLVLRSPDFVPAFPNEGQLGFFYKSMQWEAGDASGGDAGLGGVPPTIGFGDGTGNNAIVLDSSFTELNAHHIWFAPDTTPTLFGAPPLETVPEPSTLLLIGAGAAIIGRKLYSRRRQA